MVALALARQQHLQQQLRDGGPNPTGAAVPNLPSVGANSFLGSADLDAVLGGLGAPGLAENMETSLTALGLGNSLNLLPHNLAAFLTPGGNSTWIPANMFSQQQQGAAAGAVGDGQGSLQAMANALAAGGWAGLPGGAVGVGTHHPHVQGAHGVMGPPQGPPVVGGVGVAFDAAAAMEGVRTVTSGLDDMRSIEQALPAIGTDASMALLAAAQRSSNMVARAAPEVGK